jgi:FixJ family two-component response regulator
MLSLSNVPMTLQQISIAIVEDDPSIGVALKRLLAQHGYRPLLFSSAAECVRAMMRVEVACLVIDIHLGQDSGIDLARQLSAMGVKSPVIHMSGAADEETHKAAIASGCVAFLDKPFSIEMLIAAIERAIGQDFASDQDKASL